MYTHNDTRRGYIMPTTISFTLPTQKVNQISLQFNVKQLGIGKYFHIPYVFSFPYFSGSTPKIEVRITNNSSDSRDVNVAGHLHLLSEKNTIKKRGNPWFELNIPPGQKRSGILEFERLQEPGNYVVRVDCAESGNELLLNKDVMYFDALAKDSSMFNVLAIVISAFVGFAAGLISGWLIN